MFARNGGPVRLRLLRTLYPHWGSFTGIHQFVRYLPTDKYRADIRLVNDGDTDFPFAGLPVRAQLRDLVQRGGMAWYKLSDLAAEIQVAAAAATGRIDVLHYLDGEHSAQFFPRARRLLSHGRTRVIGTYHQPAALLPQLVRRDVIRQLDAVTLVSETQRQFFDGLLPPERIFVILHGIDTEAFRPMTARSDEGIFRCITVGHYLRDYATVAAVAERLRDDAGIRFDIVSPYETGLERFPNVTHHRGISDSALADLYQRAHLLLLPLHDATANNSLLEGAASGLPVLSTCLPDVKLYMPGDEAILLGRNDRDAFVDVIRQLRDDPTERTRRAALARARAEELAWPNIAPQFERCYAGVLG